MSRFLPTGLRRWVREGPVTLTLSEVIRPHFFACLALERWKSQALRTADLAESLSIYFTTISGSSRMSVFIDLETRQLFSAFSISLAARSRSASVDTVMRGWRTISVIW